jgi:two-component sensor histidine kinase
VKKRLLLVSVAALLPATVLLGYNAFSARLQLAEQVERRALEANRQATSEIERIVEGARALMVATAAIPAVQQASAAPEACREALQDIVAAIHWLRNIFVLDNTGTLVCDPLGARHGLGFADRPYFAAALERNGFFIGNYTQSRLTDVAVLPLVLPLRAKDGTTIGLLATGLRLDWLNDRLRERGVGGGGSVTIADRAGVILARTPQPERFVGTRIPEAFMHLVNAPQEGVMEVRSQDGTIRIMAYNPVSGSPEGLYISVGFSKDEAYAAVDRQTMVAILSIILGVAVALIAAWIAGGLIRRPVNRIVASIRDWKAGQAERRSGLQSRDGDVESVGEALDELLDELERRALATRQAEEQRDLLMRELSHRVKNTLALVQAIANQTFRSSDEAATHAFSERLIALSSAYDVLLGEQFGGGDVLAIIETTLRPHRRQDEAIELSGEPVMLAPSCALALSLVIHELATNATKYGALSRPTGSVSVAWSLHGTRIGLIWQERGGPPVAMPRHEGFGSRLLKRAFAAEAAAVVEIKFLLTGVRCEMSFNALVPASVAEPEVRDKRIAV